MNLDVRRTAWAVGAFAMTAAATLVPASAQADTRQPEIELTGVTTEGSGCPRRGDASATLDGDRIKVNYERLEVWAGGGGASHARANCVANLRLSVEKGWQFAIGTLSMRGYAYLEKGARVTATATHYFAGVPSTGQATETLRGPYDDEFTSWDRQHGNWSECGASRALNINASVFVEAKDAKGESGVQLNEHRGLTADLKFRRC